MFPGIGLAGKITILLCPFIWSAYLPYFLHFSLGALSKCGQISDEMITESALALADSVNEEEKAEGRIYPSLKRMRDISRDVSVRVIQMANKQGLTRDNGYTKGMDDEELKHWVEGEMWQPTYESFAA